MTKRQCPFEFTCLPQLKSHIGQKEFDLKHEENMSKIHDKTLQLLFTGTKNLYKINGNDAKIKTVNSKTGLRNQCCLKNVSEGNKLNVDEKKCYFCDKWICQNCDAVCCKCREVFCLAHSLKLYDENDECICLSCYENYS